jgi:ProP effector
MNKNQLHPRTEVLNSKQKQKSHQSRQEALTWLAKRFPQAFNTETSIQPLRVGIMQDILEFADEAFQNGISKSKLRQAVVVFTRRVDYLACLKAQGGRINLEGEICELVSEEDAQRAGLKIKKLIEKNIKIAKKVQSDNLSRVKSSYSMGMRNTPTPSIMEKEFSPSKKIEIVFKSKPNKQVDPEAVERLKSKLGLKKAETADV